ncbi:hypothetical protein JYA63_08080 [Fictibacillus nanhaiensis]|uniref:Type 4 fimbrial biogenesis protein PilX N-terminal domain-containing protein n=1 Tax=Fictibacillus nanhaiensis TaxID=742169 RepID=A0ABS2ZSB7_9BACL|nr:hypothetical protein [Fictibacillus nanhaiensis]
MRKLLSEKGNTLIIVLLMIVIFTVAGLSLVSTTFNGVKKTGARETQIQSVELAEKGIDYLSTLLETKTQPLAGLPAKDFNDSLNIIIKDYKVDHANAPFLTTATLSDDADGTLKVKIYNVKKVTSDPDDLSQTMTLHSQATVNGKTKTLISTIHLGAKQVPEALNYAIGAYNPCKGKDGCTAREDDGNMFLHGGVAIKGDLYVERNLITKDKGIVGTDNDWISSDLPSVEGENGKKAHLILPGSLYKMTSDLKYSDHIKEKVFENKSPYQRVNKENVRNAFTSFTEINKEYVPIVDTRNPGFAPIDIEGQRNKYYFAELGNSFPVTNVKDGNFNNNPHKDHIRDQYASSNVHVDSKNDIKFNGSFVFNRFSSRTYAENRDITIKNGKDGWSKLTFKQGAYFGGNVVIGDKSTSHYNYNDYEQFEIDGPIFVDGDLTIWGSHIKFNSTVYVTGKTTIRYSRLQGIQNNNIEKSLVLFGKDSILIANNNVYGDTANIIRGFFYSEEQMEIYGVGSNVEIQGGVFGRKVVLNATKGQVKRGSSQPYLFDSGQTQMSPSRSRLKIVYNPELIKNPPEGLPTVRDLSVSQIDRQLQ